MNKRQKKLITNLVFVIVFTVAMVAGLVIVKDVINRSEAMRAMDMIGQEVLRYRKAYRSLPSEAYVKQYTERIGAVRLGDYRYRAQWIEYGCDPDTTVVAYSGQRHRGILKPGGIILWLNGKIEWFDMKEFEQILQSQQKKQELKWLQQSLVH